MMMVSTQPRTLSGMAND